jgi:NADH-quinone oxidoreductase subunit C
MPEIQQTTPEERLEALAEGLEEQFGEMGCGIDRAYSELTMVVPRDKLLEVARMLRDKGEFAFAELMDVCGVDYSAYGRSEWVTDAATDTGFGRGVEREINIETTVSDRFAAVYHLLSVIRNTRLRVKVFAGSEPPMVPSVIEIWSSANWFEREAFDLFGILFEGHPDLRRILTDYGFVGHPFRKDFPLIGQVEMRYDPEKQRVIYEPVAIEARTLVPRVIREDNRYESGQAAGTDQDRDAADA